MREQVCLYMCPWPRIQAALTDEHALNVSYRYNRGEPRDVAQEVARPRCARSAKRSAIASIAPIASRSARRGSTSATAPNLGCIQCGLCIDACDSVMAKIGRAAAHRLRHRHQHQAPAGGLAPVYRLLRPRTVLYAVLIALVGSAMLYALVARGHVVAVMHDRNPLFVQTAGGSIRNGYRVARRQQGDRAA